MVMFGRDIKPLSFVLSAVLTVVFSLLVNLGMKRKLRSISMVESMKSAGMTLYAPNPGPPRAALCVCSHAGCTFTIHREVHTEEITRAGLGFAARVVFLQINQAEVLHICGASNTVS